MFIGVAKGELGEFCEAFLRKIGAKFDINGPMSQYDVLPGGSVKYRIQNSRDIPRWIGDEDIPIDFGITGFDCVLDEQCSGNKRITEFCSLRYEAKKLGFEKLLGEMVIMAKDGCKSKKDRLVVGVKDYYPSLARWQLSRMGLRPNDYRLVTMQGAIEGYLMDEVKDCDMAFETIFSRYTLDQQNDAQKESNKPEIKILRRIIELAPVIIYDNKRFRFLDFDNLFYGRGEQ